MIRRYLENYKEFECIAADCPDTCCSGWLIEIDDKSLDRFEEVSSNNADFFSRVNFSDGCFFQAQNKDCSFLLENGLCKMQKEYGEDMLCYTCDMYPRHIEEFPDVREYSLSASCPIVAKDIAKKAEYLSFFEEKDEEPDPDSIDEYEDYNELLYDKLLNIRDKMITILKEDGTFEEKSDRILDAIRTVQEDLDFGMYDGVESALDVGKDEFKPNPKTYYSYIEECFEDLNKIRILEPLREEFVCWMQNSEERIKREFVRKEICFIKKVGDFEKDYPNIDLIQCNIAIYFIFTYFCGAVYDNYVYSAARIAIFSARVIKLLSFAKWCESGEVDIDTIIYKFCRELEHSNENLNLIKQEFDYE